MTQDEEHLKLLSIFHYVVGGIAALMSLIPVIHLIIGLVLVFAPNDVTGNHGAAPPALFGWLFVIMAGLLILFGLTLATLIILTGRFIARRSHYTFCLVMGGVECLFMPLGTALGIFTIIVLIRDSVKRLFVDGNSANV